MIISFVYYAREAQDVFRGYPEMVHLNNKASFVPEPTLIEFLDHDGKSVGLVQAQTPSGSKQLYGQRSQGLWLECDNDGKSRYWYNSTYLKIYYNPRLLAKHRRKKGCWIILDNRPARKRAYIAHTDAVVPPLEGWECFELSGETPTLRYINTEPER